MKKYNLYENNLDKTWYDSTNILYSECDDIVDSLKKVRVYFSTGRVYEYKDVNVNDYLMFREGLSQGKSFNKYLRKYECERIEDCNINDIKEQLELILENNNVIENGD